MDDRGKLAHGLTLAAALLLPALLALRLPASIDGMDSANFALALTDYDLGLEQPHFPGYPVYIALCRVLARAGLDEATALALPGVLCAALLVLSLATLGRRFKLGGRSTPLAVALLVVQPLVLFAGARPIPDLFGSTLVWSALALAATGRAAGSGAVVGLALGVRADLAPFLATVFALPRAQRPAFALGALGGLASWLPLFLAAAPPSALTLALDFGRGHFTSWGSTLTAGVGSGTAIAAALLLAGGGALGLGFSALGLARAPNELRRFLLVVLAPYALWLAVGQNLAHARHLLPLAPATCLLCAHGLLSLSHPAARGIAAAALIATALPAYSAALRPHPDGRALVARAVAACGECEALYAGDSKRLFDLYGPPGFPVYRRTGIEGVALDLEARERPQGEILAAGDVPGVSAVGTDVGELASGLRLYRLDPTAISLPQR